MTTKQKSVVPESVRVSRKAECDVCINNVDDVCVTFKEMHPDRDCVVSVGITMPRAACPLRKWSAYSVED